MCVGGGGGGGEGERGDVTEELGPRGKGNGVREKGDGGDVSL